jgi:hypothetical protein
VFQWIIQVQLTELSSCHSDLPRAAVPYTTITIIMNIYMAVAFGTVEAGNAASETLFVSSRESVCARYRAAFPDGRIELLVHVL